MSSIEQYHLELFRQSLRRVTRKAGFFDSFYDNFMGQSEEIAEFFHNRDMHQLKHKLQETLQMLTDTVEGRPGSGLYIEMLGRIHQRLTVERKHFVMWEEALLETVESYDDEFDGRIQAAWREVIESVIERMYSTTANISRAAS